MTHLDKYLSFVLGEEKFALPLLRVREVIALPTITPMPQAPQHVLGVMNLREQIITIFDMRSCLKLKSPRADRLTVVICDLDIGQVGFVVDSVTSVLSVAPEHISSVPPGSKASDKSYVTNIHRKENELTMILDAEQLLSVEVRLQIQSLNQKTA